MEYSKRLENITDEQFQKALERFNLGTFVKAEPIPFGLFGQNVFLTSDKGEYVFRGKPHYSWQFPSEKFFADLLHERTSVPVPYPYMLDEETDIFGWNYIIMPRLYGINLADEKVRKGLDKETRKEICVSLAKTLADIHTVSWECSGNYSEKERIIIPFDKLFHEWVYQRIREALDNASKFSDWTNDEDKQWVEGILADAEDAMKMPFTPTIVMGDYREGNCTAQEVDGVWQITGVFDLMELYMGDGEVALSRILAGSLEEAPELIPVFLDAYFSQATKREGFEKRFPVYMLFDRVKIWEYAQRTGSWKGPKTSFKEWCEKYISLYKDKP